MTNPTPPAPLVKYQAYVLVQLEERATFTIPAPGVTVYLAEDVERVLNEHRAFFKRIAENDLLSVSLRHEAQRLLAQVGGKP